MPRKYFPCIFHSLCSVLKVPVDFYSQWCTLWGLLCCQSKQDLLIRAHKMSEHSQAAVTPPGWTLKLKNVRLHLSGHLVHLVLRMFFLLEHSVQITNSVMDWLGQAASVKHEGRKGDCYRTGRDGHQTHYSVLCKISLPFLSLYSVTSVRRMKNERA